MAVLPRWMSLDFVTRLGAQGGLGTFLVPAVLQAEARGCWVWVVQVGLRSSHLEPEATHSLS